MQKIFFSAVLVGLIVLGVWLYWGIYSEDVSYRMLGHLRVPYQAGAWGDSFGAFNALFGALGFTAVVTTLFIQGRALRLQQEDQHRQRFESTFFELLKLMREMKSDARFNFTVDYRTQPNGRVAPVGTSKEGHYAFRAAILELSFWKERATNSPIPKEELVKIFEEKIFERYESTFSPYFRIVYTILHRIKSDLYLSEPDKDRYGNLLRSQLTTFEAALIGINGLSSVSKDLSTLIIRFRLLKYLPEKKIRTTLERFYPEETFKERPDLIKMNRTQAALNFVATLRTRS